MQIKECENKRILDEGGQCGKQGSEGDWKRVKSEGEKQGSGDKERGNRGEKGEYVGWQEGG